jgi:thiol peroxidase
MANVTLKGKPIHTKGDLPQIGAKAPDFVLVDADLKDRSLADYQGKKKILSIVPSLDTPTCFLSAKKFNEAASKLSNTVVLVISADLPFAQKRVCGAENLKNIIPLSLMRSKKFAEDYGVLIQDGPLAGVCSRAIVVLDEQDKVVYTELVGEVTHEPDYEKALKSIQKM